MIHSTYVYVLYIYIDTSFYIIHISMYNRCTLSVYIYIYLFVVYYIHSIYIQIYVPPVKFSPASASFSRSTTKKRTGDGGTADAVGTAGEKSGGDVPWLLICYDKWLLINS